MINCELILPKFHFSIYSVFRITYQLRKTFRFGKHVSLLLYVCLPNVLRSLLVNFYKSIYDYPNLRENILIWKPTISRCGSMQMLPVVRTEDLLAVKYPYLRHSWLLTTLSFPRHDRSSPRDS